jgi:hypothetical protein
MDICTDSLIPAVATSSFFLSAEYNTGSIIAFYNLFLDEPLDNDITFYFTNYLYLTLGGRVEILGTIFIPSGEIYGNAEYIESPDYSLLNGVSEFGDFIVEYIDQIYYTVNTSYTFGPSLPTPTPVNPSDDLTYLLIPNNDFGYEVTPDLTPTPTPTPTITPSSAPIAEFLYVIIPKDDLRSDVTPNLTPTPTPTPSMV